MSTRSRIGLELNDGSVVSVYHHFDGYPEWLGKTLNKFYNTREKVAELIDGGDMSVCLNDEGAPEPQYYTNRGESVEANAPRLDRSLGHYCDKDNGEEYHYLYRLDENWICVDQHQWDGTDKDPEVVAIPA